MADDKEEAAPVEAPKEVLRFDVEALPPVDAAPPPADAEEPLAERVDVLESQVTLLVARFELVVAHLQSAALEQQLEEV